MLTALGATTHSTEVGLPLFDELAHRHEPECAVEISIWQQHRYGVNSGRAHFHHIQAAQLGRHPETLG